MSFFEERIEKLTIAISSLLFFTFPIWFLMENFLSLFMSMIIEIKQIPKWNLSDVYVGLMSGGILFNALYLLIICLILSYLMIRYFKIGKSNFLYFMKLDLNTKYRIFTLLFYIDFFGFRSLILIFFGVSGIVKSIILWYLILVFYLISFLMNIARIYQKIIDQVLYCVNYVHVLIVILYFIVLHH